MVKNTSAGVIIRHQENLIDINPTSDFTQRAFNINPGIASTFPWLSTIAANYEQWKPRGILFMYKAMSSNALNSVNTSLGSVIMATEYNSADTLAYISKQDMENQEFSNSVKPSKSCIHPVECSKYQNPMSILYNRTGGVPPNADVRLYDLGIFTVATQGMQSTEGTIGELWVSYEIEFFKPRQSNLTVETNEQWEVVGSATAGNISQILPFGNLPSILTSTFVAGRRSLSQDSRTIIAGFTNEAVGQRIYINPLIPVGTTIEFRWTISEPGIILGANNVLRYNVLGGGSPATLANTNMWYCQPVCLRSLDNTTASQLDSTIGSASALTRYTYVFRIRINQHGRNQQPTFLMSYSGAITNPGTSTSYNMMLQASILDNSYVQNCFLPALAAII
jgi:hypothetical protein